MPVPKWIAQINKRTFNKMELKRGKRPVLTHVGRKSGKTHATPLDAHPIDGGFIFLIMYGSKGCDWVQNILASGTAALTIQDEDWQLASPRLITREEAAPLVAADTNLEPGRIKGIEYLRMDIAG
jgi:deazaflavin-dependent oxidoreductase (nitroreductase family)